MQVLDASDGSQQQTSNAVAGTTVAGSRMVNAMTVDVEDYFQVQAFAGRVTRPDWQSFPCRVEANMDKILALFAEAGVKATFFTLGWIAERYPDVVRRIVAEGHELASHGYAHFPIFDQTPEEFRADVRRTKRILEDAGQVPIRGYRAASFSLTAKTPWAHDVLASEGYAYSSSIYPIHHDFYGIPGAPRHAYRPSAQSFLEVPMTTLALFGQKIPCGGGGYFRLSPYVVSRWALRRINAEDRLPCVFYFHPWEIDPDQPRIAGAPLKSRLRHYLNLRQVEGRLRRLLADFTWSRMDRVFLSAAE